MRTLTMQHARQPAAMTEANRELRLKSCRQSWCRRRLSPSRLRPRLAGLAAGPWPGGRGRERSSLSSTDQSLRRRSKGEENTLSRAYKGFPGHVITSRCLINARGLLPTRCRLLTTRNQVRSVLVPQLEYSLKRTEMKLRPAP
ncbi:hypothetical protein Bbelb_063670 [Branchiostoma belcheri]|nr:hypothetical protein Bbelb_063670 [Branchiostoma belcheri]